MAGNLYSFVCSACNEPAARAARKQPKYCEPCADFRQEWLRMRAPSQWQSRCCNHCGVPLLNCVHGKARVCPDCRQISERRRWKTIRSPREARPGRIICKSCEQDLPAQYLRHDRRRCTDCQSALRSSQRSLIDRSPEWLRRKEVMRPALDVARAARAVEAEKRALVSRRRAACERAGARWRRARLLLRKPWLSDGVPQGERWRLRYRHDSDFHTSERLRQSLRRKRRGKERSIAYWMRRAAKGMDASVGWAERFLGYSATDLRHHLQRQFIQGMTWGRFVAGEIDIDHIIPVSAFDLSVEGEIKAAWALSNLRPMWSHDNRQKWAKRTHLL